MWGPCVWTRSFTSTSPPDATLQSGRRHLDAVWEQALPAAGYRYEVLQFAGEATAAEIERVVAAGQATGAKAVIV